MSLNTFDVLRRDFSFLSSSKSKNRIDDRSFIAALITGVANDSATGSLEGLRRNVIDFSEISITRQSFHERMGTRKLHKNLTKVLELQQLNISENVKAIARLLGVEAIYLQDSATSALPSEARHIFPGVNTDKKSGAAKIHLTLDLLSSNIPNHDISPGTDNDSNYFVPENFWKGNLTIADLGYYSFDRFEAIDVAGGFFLSRLKTNVSGTITGVADKGHEANIGAKLHESEWDQDIVDLRVIFGTGTEACEHRVIGCWNEEEKKYHFYITNLKCAKEAIWPLYRMRWQIELAFKAMKQSLMPRHITSSNPMVIRNLLLLIVVRFAVFLNLSSVFEEFHDLDEEPSIQKIAKVVHHIARDIYCFISKPVRKNLERLCNKIKLFVKEVFHKRQRSKKTSREILRETLNEF